MYTDHNHLNVCTHAVSGAIGPGDVGSARVGVLHLAIGGGGELGDGQGGEELRPRDLGLERPQHQHRGHEKILRPGSHDGLFTFCNQMRYLCEYS